MNDRNTVKILNVYASLRTEAVKPVNPLDFRLRLMKPSYLNNWFPFRVPLMSPDDKIADLIRKVFFK